MNRTFTPDLTPEVLDRLRDYAELFREDFRYKSQHAWSGVYLRGLLQDGDRKSIEPMAVTAAPRLLAHLSVALGVSAGALWAAHHLRLGRAAPRRAP